MLGSDTLGTYGSTFLRYRVALHHKDRMPMVSVFIGVHILTITLHHSINLSLLKT